MDVAKTLREARLAARLTQRQLAARAGVPQSTVARIESGRLMPRVDLFDDLLRAAELRVVAEPRPGYGIDRTLMHEVLRWTPEQRILNAALEANRLNELLRTARRP
jgi:transcriptional regulator with XRE-family HTH domain